MAQVLFKFGTPEAYAGLGTYEDNALYFIQPETGATEGVLYKGSVRYSPEKQIEFVSEAPASPEDDKIYVVNDGSSVTIVTKGSDGTPETIGGGTVQPGGISDIGAFDDTVLVKSGQLQDGKLPDNDTSIPTSGAIRDAIEAAIGPGFIDVAFENPSAGNTYTVTFTSANQSQKTINIPKDSFVSSGSYDNETKILTLTLTNGSPVEIDMSELVPPTSTFSTIEVGQGNGFEVNLGSGVGLGGFTAGEEIPEDMTLAEFAKKLLMKQVPPTYTEPSVSISRSGGTTNGNVEIGTNVSVSLSSTFTQNDAGALTNIQFKKGGSNVGEASSTSPATYTETLNAFDAAVSYTAVASYSDGPIKNDNLGQPYPTGQIKAGSKTSSSIAFNPYRKGFYGAVTSKDAAIDSAFVRSLSSSTTSAPAQGNTWTIQIPVGTLRVAFAYPATLRDVNSVKDVNGLNAEIKSAFALSTVSVEGANGYAGINYKVYVTDFANPTDAANSYTVQI